MIDGHVCSAYCSPDSGEHCELVWSNFDPHPGEHWRGPYEGVRRHYDDAYRLRYGARVVRCEPAREAPPIETMDPAILTQLVGWDLGTHPWLIWFVPRGPAAEAFVAAEDAIYAERLAWHREQAAAARPMEVMS